MIHGPAPDCPHDVVGYRDWLNLHEPRSGVFWIVAGDAPNRYVHAILPKTEDEPD